MARSVMHDTPALLDAALRLAAEAGPAAVSMSAVARAAGAPSGSVYHRFPQRSALLAALWLRTVTGFQDGFVTALGGEPPRRAAVAVACHVLAWSRAHPDEARVLLYGPADFGVKMWPPEARRELAAANRRIADTLDRLATRLDTARDRLTLLTVDIPYAIVRRHLLGGTPIPVDAGELVEQCAAGLLRAI